MFSVLYTGDNSIISKDWVVISYNHIIYHDNLFWSYFHRFPRILDENPHLFPSLFRKCGYCKLKWRSKSVSKNGGLRSSPAIPFDWCRTCCCCPRIPALLPPPPPGVIICGTGISCERKVRFELCILTANESDVKSGGNGVINDNRVIFKEHNLEGDKRESK